MITMTIQEANAYIPLILNRLKEINPAKVILFGSYARGTETTESDLDLLVVTHHNEMPKDHRQKEQIYLGVARKLRDIRGKVPIDLVVHTRAMHQRFLELDSLFSRELLQNGIVLYESDYP